MEKFQCILYSFKKLQLECSLYFTESEDTGLLFNPPALVDWSANIYYDCQYGKMMFLL